MVYVWNYPTWGGAQIYFLALMQEAKKRFKVSALIPRDSPQRIIDQLDKMSINYRHLDATQIVSTGENISETVTGHAKWARNEWKLVRQLAREFDLTSSIVHLDLGFWQSFVTLFRLSLKTNVFVTIHTALPKVSAGRRLIWKIKGSLLSRRKNFHLLASNEDARTGLEPYLSAAKFSEIKVAYSGIDKHEFASLSSSQISREAICGRYGLDPAAPIIISLGQFIERKGCWIVLEALQRLRTEYTDVRFLWMGTSVPDAQIIRKIDDHGLSDSFRLMSSEEIGSSRRDVLDLLSVADIFVLASLEEGLPIALVEAMALGKACIATRVNAIPEAITDGITGLLISPNNVSELVDAMQKLISDDMLRGKLGMNARTKALSTFDAQVGAETTVRSYEQALS